GCRRPGAPDRLDRGRSARQPAGGRGGPVTVEIAGGNLTPERHSPAAEVPRDRSFPLLKRVRLTVRPVHELVALLSELDVPRRLGRAAPSLIASAAILRGDVVGGRFRAVVVVSMG